MLLLLFIYEAQVEWIIVYDGQLSQSFLGIYRNNKLSLDFMIHCHIHEIISILSKVRFIYNIIGQNP